jgi:hypothetical protein
MCCATMSLIRRKSNLLPFLSVASHPMNKMHELRIRLTCALDNRRQPILWAKHEKRNDNWEKIRLPFCSLHLHVIPSTPHAPHDTFSPNKHSAHYRSHHDQRLTSNRTADISRPKEGPDKKTSSPRTTFQLEVPPPSSSPARRGGGKRWGLGDLL